MCCSTTCTVLQTCQVDKQCAINLGGLQHCGHCAAAHPWEAKANTSIGYSNSVFVTPVSWVANDVWLAAGTRRHGGAKILYGCYQTSVPRACAWSTPLPPYLPLPWPLCLQPPSLHSNQSPLSTLLLLSCSCIRRPSKLARTCITFAHSR